MVGEHLERVCGEAVCNESMSSEKRVLNKRLCIKKESRESKQNKDSESENKALTTHPHMHKNVKELFQIVAQIYLENRRSDYTIKSFKSSLSFYLGFDERTISPRFNMLANLGIITVKRQSRGLPHGHVSLNINALLDRHNCQELSEAWTENKTALETQAKEEAQKLVEKMSVLSPNGYKKGNW